MKKLLILLIGIGVFSCKETHDKKIFNDINPLNSLGVEEKNLIQGSFIVYLREDKYVPILTEFQKADLIKDKEKQALIESEKISEIQKFASKYGLELRKEDLFIYASSGFYVENSDTEVIDRIVKDTENVSGVQQDFTIQDIRARMQFTGPLPQNIRARMQADWGYDALGFTSRAVTYVGGGADAPDPDRKIWIVDSGIDASHQDLQGLLNSGLDTTFFRSNDNDEKNPLKDFIGHGTHCAGLAAGKAFNQSQPNNQILIGMNGVSRGAKLVSLKVFANNREAKWNSLWKAIEYVSINSKGLDVVSLSLGAHVNNCNNPNLRRALENLALNNVFVVMAAGNGVDGIGVDVSEFVPGCMDGMNGIYTIGSVRQDYIYSAIPIYFSIFSNFGPQLDWVAPGEQIFSTYPGNLYAVASGTSAATAIVAGIIHANGGPPVELATVVGPPGTSNYKIAKRK